MRNKINVIVCIMIVACVAIFAVACVPKDGDGLIKLASPSNLNLNGSVLSWDEVENAKEYFISVDGVENERSVTTTTCDLSAMVTGYGNFSITVRAYGDGKKYGTSDKSQAIVYHKGNALDTPVVTIADKVASWNAVDKAVEYSVRVTDSKGALLDELTSDALSYDFTKKKVGDDEEEKDIYGDYGAYRISVIANPASDNIEYSPSLAGVATYYNSTVLSVPKFTDMTGSTIRWGAITNATNYTLRKTYEDGTYEDAVVTGTSYAYRTKFNLEKVGAYTFTIRANGDNQVYYTSEFSEKDNEYVVNKLAAVDPQDISLTYDAKGSAKLSWKLAADSLATEFTLNLSALLPDGSVKLESSILQQTISNKIVFVVADVYDFYKYDADGEGLIKEDGTTILVYNMNGFAKVRYDGKDYFLKDKDGNDVMWKNYTPSASVDVICDMSDPDNIKFVNERKEYTNPDNGAILSQNTGEDQDVLDDGKQLFYYEKVDGETEIEVKQDVEYDADGVTVKYHTFEIMLDDIFIRKTTEDGESKYDYLISDNAYYGLLYDVSISADNTSKNYVVSQSTATSGQYMSYKIPEMADGRYVVTNTGEYAYIILNSFINPDNTDEFSIEENINFNGYEVAQIEMFGGVIDGNKHTVSGIVIGNKVMTQNGVVKNDSVSDLEYSMFVNIDSKGNSKKGIIENIFYVGVSFVGYDKEDIDENVKSIKVAPIAINNKGTIRDSLVQSDSIKAEGAQVAGLVINNYAYIGAVSVYAELEGMTVGGFMINNEQETIVSSIGFYGKVTATLSDVLTDGITSIGGAGIVVNNKGNIFDSFAIGDVSVTAAGLDSVYAGGFVAVNDGNITQSYSGEFTLNNAGITEVVANGNNAYAGGFVGLNRGDVASCYSTNKATASMYSGGFAGFNGANVTSCYSTGGTARTGENNGSFVGKNDGAVVKSVCYSTDSWAKDEAVEVFKSSEKLGDFIAILYDGEEEVDMVLMREQGYRNPLLKRVIYLLRTGNDTSEERNIVTMRPSQTVDTQAFFYLNGELKEVESILRGDNTKKGNRIVVELKGEHATTRYVYGYVN